MTYALQVTEVEVQRYRMMAGIAAAAEAAQWAAAGIVPGAVVADVGCGPGAMSLELARAVAPGGRVLAVDQDEQALAAAAQVTADEPLVELRQGQATATGLQPGSVDVAVLRHVLAHNGGSEQAIVDHLATLVRPGGTVYLVDVELTASRFRGADPALEDLPERYLDFHRRRGNDLAVGLRLGELLRGAGLVDVVHTGRFDVLQPPPGSRPPMWAALDAMRAEGLVDDADVARWSEGFARTDASPERPTMFAALFVGWGRRPA